MPRTLYLHAHGRKIAQVKDGVRTDYLTDALGSITATKNQSQQIVNTYRWKPYGGQLAKTGTGEDPKYGWTGDTGSRKTSTNWVNQYNVYRHYGSQQAAWTTVDPLWPEESAYHYSAQNPTLFLDATGLCCQQLVVTTTRGWYGCKVHYNLHRPLKNFSTSPNYEEPVDPAVFCGCRFGVKGCPDGDTGSFHLSLEGRYFEDEYKRPYTQIKKKAGFEGCIKGIPVAGLERLAGLIRMIGAGGNIGTIVDWIIGHPGSGGKKIYPPLNVFPDRKCKFEFAVSVTYRYRCYECNPPPRRDTPRCGPKPDLGRIGGLGIPGASSGGKIH